MPLPTPRKGESKNDFISRFMSSDQTKRDFPENEQRVAVAHQKWRDKHGGKKPSESAKWQLLEFSTPIKESAFVDDEFIIKGIAINETTTHNGHKYIAEELEKAAPGLIGKPLLVDHDNRVESIKGKVSNSFFDDYSKSINFEAKVMDKTIRDMINDGRINNVSIGAFAKDLIKEEETGDMIAKGLDIVELSLVAVPADHNATFATAMDNCYKIKESYSLSEDNIESKREVKEMAEEKKVTEDNKLKETSEKLEKSEELIKEYEEKLKAYETEKRNSLINKYKKVCEEKGLEIQDVSNINEETINLLINQAESIKLPKKEVAEEKVELKSEIQTEIPSEQEDFVVERGMNGISMWRMPNVKKWNELHWDYSKGAIPTK